MFQYIMDFGLVVTLIVVITAIMGVLSNGIGEKIFGGKGHTENFSQSAKTQVGWKSIGGKNK